MMPGGWVGGEEEGLAGSVAMRAGKSPSLQTDLMDLLYTIVKERMVYHMRTWTGTKAFQQWFSGLQQH